VDRVPAQRIKPRISKAAGVVLAIAGAIAAQLLLVRTREFPDHEAVNQALAGALMIGAALVFGAATHRSRDSIARLELLQPSLPGLVSVPEPPSSFRWMACAIFLASAAVIAFAKNGESPAVVAGWLCGIAALFWSHRPSASIRPRIQRETVGQKAAVAALLVIAAIAGTYRLSTLPYNVDGDFASVGLAARALAAGQQQIFSLSWAGVPALGYLPPALTMLLFGDGLVGLNASGLIEGLLTILGVYLLGRDLFYPRIGIFAAALLTASYTYIAASRQSSYIDPVPFILYSVYFLLIGLREERRWAIVTSAMLAALCLQMYSSGRLLVPILASLLLYLLLVRPRPLHRVYGAMALWTLSLAITLGPMVVVFARNGDMLTQRTREVFLLNPDIIHHERGVYQTDSLAGILAEQARRSALLFHYYPDTGTQFALLVPFLDPFTGILFTLGIGYALFTCRRAGSALLLAWTALALVLGSFLTANPPFWPHLIVLLPPAVLLAALGLEQVYSVVQWKNAGRRVEWVRPAAVIVVLAFVGIQNWQIYVAAKNKWAWPRTRIARYVANLAASEPVYLVSNDFKFTDREFEFLVPGRLRGNLTPTLIEEDSSLPGRSTTLILTKEHERVVRRLGERYPGSHVETHAGNIPGEVAFYVFRLP
jgi:4-amino-4-deoxy-L-arabinose transferase-like glycosyltransferase